MPVRRSARHGPAAASAAIRTLGRAAVAPAAAVLLAFLFAACENGDSHLFPDPFGPGNQGGTISLRRQVQPIFTLHCVGCHGGGVPEQGLSLESGRLYDPAVGAVGVRSVEQPSRLRIEAGSSRSSYLFRKITGNGIVGERMPLGGTLSAEEIDVIREWIDDGAPNN